MCNKRIVSGENSWLYSISSFSSRRRLIIKMKISDNFKLMHITATQIIAHYSISFDPIQKSFKALSLNFKAMASVVLLVGMAKNYKRFLNQEHAGHRLAHAWFLKIDPV